MAPDATRLAVVRDPDERQFTIDILPATPGRLLTGIVTERGICSATAGGLAALFAPGTRR